MLHVVLVEPRIPPNTGNVIRLCANTGAELHLVQPLGFELDAPRLRRAGLDYREWARVRVHDDFAGFRRDVAPPRLFAFTTRGSQPFHRVRYQSGDALLFGAETSGLPEELLRTLPEDHWLRLPMVPGNRSLNLSNAVAVAVFEAWRQWGYAGGEPR